MIEVKEPNRDFKPSFGTEIRTVINSNVRGIEVSRKLETIEKPDNDFRDFIKGKISMDELFKKREKECQSK